jgi:spore germination protein YaaH
MRPLLAILLVLAALARAPGGLAAARPEVVGFYVPWDAQSKSSLAANLDALTVFAPQWVNLADAAGALRIVDDPAAQEVLKAARRPPKIMPLVTNAHDAQWDAAAADAMLLTPGVRSAFITALAAAAAERGFSGYILDFENLSPDGAAAYPALVAALKAALAPRGGRVWATAPLVMDAAALKALAAAGDATVLMAYDECWATSTPGPIAGVDWIEARLAARRGALAPDRTVLALGSYAYDWPLGGAAKVLSVAAALEIAKARGAPVAREPASTNAAFDYTDEAGQAHQVWIADAPAFAAARNVIGRAGLQSWGVWRLGLEDAALWRRSVAPPTSGPALRARPPACEPLPR